jgi:hypothetical protein
MDKRLMNMTAALHRIRTFLQAGALRGMNVLIDLALWATVTALLLLRPVVGMVLVPIGVIFFFLALLVGFWAEARPIAEHRWAVLGIGLGSILLAQLYDEVIRILDRLRTDVDKPVF